MKDNNIYTNAQKAEELRKKEGISESFIAAVKAVTNPQPIAESEQIDELSKGTLVSYAKKAQRKADANNIAGAGEEEKAMETNGKKFPAKQMKHVDAADKFYTKGEKRQSGVNLALGKMGDKAAKKVQPSGLWGQQKATPAKVMAKEDAEIALYTMKGSEPVEVEVVAEHESGNAFKIVHEGVAKWVPASMLSEISKEKAGNYIKKASDEANMSGFRAGVIDPHTHVDNPKYVQGQHNQAHKRLKGIGKAVDKITGKAKVNATESVNEAILSEHWDKMSDGAKELVLHADNTHHMEYSSKVPIQNNLAKKHRKGVYNSEKAKKLWGYHADRAAQSYHKEHGHPSTPWHKMFSKDDRKQAAAHWESMHHDELKEGYEMGQSDSPFSVTEAIDTASCNIPMAGGRGKRLDAEISRNVKQQAKDSAAKHKGLRAKFNDEKSTAKAAHAEHGAALVAHFGPKLGHAKVKEHILHMSKNNPSMFMKMVDKFKAEQKNTNEEVELSEMKKGDKVKLNGWIKSDHPEYGQHVGKTGHVLAGSGTDMLHVQWQDGKKSFQHKSHVVRVNPLKEDVEQVDEISKAKLGRYIKYASDDAGTSLARYSTGPENKEDWNTRSKNLSKFIKRTKGVNKAVDKLTKEDALTDAEIAKLDEIAASFENIDEAKGYHNIEKLPGKSHHTGYADGVWHIKKHGAKKGWEAYHQTDKTKPVLFGKDLGEVSAKLEAHSSKRYSKE